MADAREENVYMAKLAEQAERYDGEFRSRFNDMDPYASYCSRPSSYVDFRDG